MERILGLKWSRRALGRCTPCPCSVTRTAAQGQGVQRPSALRLHFRPRIRSMASKSLPLPPREEALSIQVLQSTREHPTSLRDGITGRNKTAPWSRAARPPGAKAPGYEGKVP